MADKVSLKTLALAKSYTAKSLIGGGAVRGKPCRIKSIEDVAGGKKINFIWYLDDGSTQETSTIIKDGIGIKDAYVDANNHLILVRDDDTEIDAGELPSGGGDSTEYEFAIEGTKLTVTDSSTGIKQSLQLPTSSAGGIVNDLPVGLDVGGIKKPKTYVAGTEVETILNDLLNPVMNPTLTNPSVSLSANIATLLEVGETKNATLTCTYNRGSINPKFSTNGYRAGVATSYSLNGGDEQSQNTFSIVVSESNKTFSAKVTHEAGQQPTNSAGDNYQSPYPAGSLTTSNLNFEFEHPMYSNASDITTVSKETLIRRSVGEKIFHFPASNPLTPETFDVPNSWSVTGIFVRNELNGNYEDAIGTYGQEQVVHQDAAGNDVSYTRYKDARGYASGSRDIKVTWN